MRMKGKQVGTASEDFSFLGESEARKKIDKIIKKHGKKSGSGYTMNVEQLLKVCDELEREKENNLQWLEEWKKEFDGAWDYDALGQKRQIFISKTAFNVLKKLIEKKILEKGEGK